MIFFFGLVFLFIVFFCVCCLFGECEVSQFLLLVLPIDKGKLSCVLAGAVGSPPLLFEGIALLEFGCWHLFILPRYSESLSGTECLD